MEQKANDLTAMRGLGEELRWKTVNRRLLK